MLLRVSAVILIGASKYPETETALPLDGDIEMHHLPLKMTANQHKAIFVHKILPISKHNTSYIFIAISSIA